jgi:hypothetical protein
MNHQVYDLLAVLTHPYHVTSMMEEDDSNEFEFTNYRRTQKCQSKPLLKK